jgi:hypothetical protein
MAAIDKLRTSYYSDYNDLRLWCMRYNPSLLYNMYEVFLSHDEWNRLQHRQSKNTDYGDDRELIIAHFTFKQDKYLYWHCPLPFIREYLQRQCGYKKANWFVKLFWKL